MAQPVDSLIKNRRIALDSSLHGDMVDGEVPLRHDLLQVAIHERECQSDAKEEEARLRNAAEQRWPFSDHDTPYHISSTAFLIEPRC